MDSQNGEAGLNYDISKNSSINNNFQNDSQQSESAFERRLAYLITITFGITIIVGIVGNLLVLLTILFQKQMRSTTNILILNLAIAELLFICICVPLTALNYVVR